MGTPDITLGGWLARRAADSSDARAITFEGSTATFGDVLDRVDRLASSLRERGVCPGDRVAFLGLNQPAFLETLFATARLGAIFVPLNFRLTLDELRDFGGRALARYKLPTHLQLIDSLPRNPAGKVLKYELRERFGPPPSPPAG